MRKKHKKQSSLSRMYKELTRVSRSSFVGVYENTEDILQVSNSLGDLRLKGVWSNTSASSNFPISPKVFDIRPVTSETKLRNATSQDFTHIVKSKLRRGRLRKRKEKSEAYSRTKEDLLKLIRKGYTRSEYKPDNNCTKTLRHKTSQDPLKFFQLRDKKHQFMLNNYQKPASTRESYSNIIPTPINSVTPLGSYFAIPAIPLVEIRRKGKRIINK